VKTTLSLDGEAINTLLVNGYVGRNHSKTSPTSAYNTKEFLSDLFLLLKKARTYVNGVIINSLPILLHIIIISGLSVMQQGSTNRVVPEASKNLCH